MFLLHADVFAPLGWTVTGFSYLSVSTRRFLLTVTHGPRVPVPADLHGWSHLPLAR